MRLFLVLLIWTGIVRTALAQDVSFIVPPATQIKNLTEVARKLKEENTDLRSKVSTLEYVVAVSDTLLKAKETRLKKLNQEAEARINQNEQLYLIEKQQREKLEANNRRLAEDNQRIQQDTSGSKIIALLAVIGTIAAILVR